MFRDSWAVPRRSHFRVWPGCGAMVGEVVTVALCIGPKTSARFRPVPWFSDRARN